MAIYIVTLQRLDSAINDVRNELFHLGFLDGRLDQIEIYLVPAGCAFGWQWYRSSGEIDIPAVSLSRLSHFIGYEYAALRDVLRHEYAHALAHTHLGLLRSKEFKKAFGASHDSETEFEFDPEFHVTEYAATSASEDFAENFMFFVKYGGRVPARFDKPAIKQKWRFIRRLGSAIAKSQRRFTPRNP